MFISQFVRLQRAAVAAAVILIGSGGCGGKEAPEETPEVETSSSSTLSAPENEADRVIVNIVGHFEALNSILTRIQDEESAKRQVPEVKRLVDELHVTLVKGTTLDPDQKAQATLRYQSQLDAETQAFSENLGRLMTIPGASAPIIEVLESMPGLEPEGSSAQPPDHIDLANPPGHDHEGHDHEGESHEGHDHEAGEGHDHEEGDHEGHDH
jgi:hypothetical protein